MHMRARPSLPGLHRAIDPATVAACRAAFDLSKETGFADGGLIGQLTDQTGNGRHLTATSTARPTFEANELNGYGVCRFDGVNDVLAGASTFDFKFLHDGHSHTMIALVKVLDADPNRINTLVDTSGAGGSSTHGVFWALDDRAAASRVNAVIYSISKNSAGNYIIDLSVQNVMQPQRWHIYVVRYACEANDPYAFNSVSGASDATLMVDGLAVTGNNAANLGHSQSNSTQVLTVGWATSTLWSKMDLAGLWIFNLALADDLLASVIRWITKRFDVGYNRIVAPGYGYHGFPSITPCGDGTHLIAYDGSYTHDPNGEETPILMQRTGNEGWDFSVPEQLYGEADLTIGGSSVFRTRSGSLLFVGYTHNGGTTQSLFVLRSTDKGRTWGSKIIPIHGFTLWSAMQATFFQSSNGDIWFSCYGLMTAGTFTLAKIMKSTDDGATWATAVTIGNGPGGSKSWSEAGLVHISGTSPNETVHAYIRNDTDVRIDKSVSTDSMATWNSGGNPTSMLTGVAGFPFGMKAASGNIFVACRSTTSPNRGVIRWSGNVGATWSANDYHIDGIAGWCNYYWMIEVRAGRFLVLHSSEDGAKSTNPTQSLLRAMIHREEDIIQFT